MLIQAQTIHVQYFDNGTSTEEFDHQELIKELFNNCLKEDKTFHYFYEQTLIIRIFEPETLENVKSYLLKNSYKFFIYDYPTPSNNGYGETPQGIVMNYFELFREIFHINAISALKMTKKEHLYYSKNMIESLLTIGKYSLKQSSKQLKILASYKEETSFTNMAKEFLSYYQDDGKLDQSTLQSDEFLTLIKTITITKKKMSEDEYFLFMERVIHSMFNMRGCSRNLEGQILLSLAEDKQKQSELCCTIL